MFKKRSKKLVSPRPMSRPISLRLKVSIVSRQDAAIEVTEIELPDELAVRLQSRSNGIHSSSDADEEMADDDRLCSA